MKCKNDVTELNVTCGNTHNMMQIDMENNVICNNNNDANLLKSMKESSMSVKSDCQPMETDDAVSTHTMYSEITFDISDNESDISSMSSISNTSASSSECDKVPLLVRVTKEICDCMVNKECVILLPKLTTQTIEYWKPKACIEDPVKQPDLNPIHSGSSTPLLPTDYSPLNDTSDDDMVPNNEQSRSTNNLNNVKNDTVDSKALDASNSSMSEFEGFTEGDLPQETKCDDTSSNKSTHLCLENNEDSTDSTSESDSLINPRASFRPKNHKCRTTPINYQDMCNKSQSDSDNASFTEVKSKPTKPIPGMVPSHIRVTAQNLIVKRRALKGLNTQFPEYSTDSDLI